MKLFQNEFKILLNSFGVKASLNGFVHSDIQILNYLDNLKVKNELISREEIIIYPGFSKNLVLYGFGSFLEQSSYASLSNYKIEKIVGDFEDAAEYATFFKSTEPLIFLESNFLPQSVVNELNDLIKVSKEMKNGTLKFSLLFKNNGQVIFVFKGVYSGEQARFNLREKKLGQKFLIGTGNKYVDIFQKTMLDNFDQVNVEDSIGCDYIIFDSFPRNSILSKSYVEKYKKYLDNNRDCIDVSLDNFGDRIFYDEIVVDGFVLRPQTWVVKTQSIYRGDFADIGLPKSVVLNIFGGLFKLDTSDIRELRKRIELILNDSPKTVDYLVLEKNYYEDLVFPVCEIYVGFTNE